MTKQTCKECESEDFNVIDGAVVCKFCGEVMSWSYIAAEVDPHELLEREIERQGRRRDQLSAVWSADTTKDPVGNMKKVVAMMDKPELMRRIRHDQLVAELKRRARDTLAIMDRCVKH